MNNQDIETIRKSANIVEIISSYIPLTQKGKNFFGVCPFHEDHSPSMSVSEEKQIYKCFSCGASGNVFTFVSEYENVSFLEAVKIIAEKCGLTFNGSIKSSKKPLKPEYEIMDLALKFYGNNLNTALGEKAKAYLKNRKLDENTIKEFDLGLALNMNYPLYPILLKKGYKKESIEELGLIHENNSKIYDTFQNRILFPIHDLEGHVVGFTGRIYEESDQAKYMNSKESSIFKKGNILFNYHRAKNEIKRKKEVIIVEGNMDAIRMSSVGIKNTIALMGTSLTQEQVEIIKNLRSKVILMFDNDDAGEIATFNNGNILENHGISPFVVRLTGEKDPDEYIIKNGVNAIINNIDNPIHFLDFKLKYLKKNKDLSKTDDLVKYIKDILDSIKDLDDELTKEVTIKKMSEEYDIPLDLLKTELAKINNTKKINVEPQKKLAKRVRMKYDIACENIIYYMMNAGEYIEIFKKELGYFNIKKYRDLANEIIYYYETNHTISLSEFITFASTKDYLESSVKEILSDVNVLENNELLLRDYIKAAKEESLKTEIKELKEKIRTELDANKKMEYAMKLVELKKGCVGNE